jgi:hypothetical protein
MQAGTASPLMITVQHPQAPSSQDFFEPVNPKRSRKVTISVSYAGS